MNHIKVLIVEDDAFLREAIVDTLSIGGYQVLQAESAEKAMLVLNDQTPNLVVTDVQLGGLTGLNLLKSIKQKFPTMPVLLMTAYAKIDDAVGAMRDGALDYLTKPFAPEVLLNLVERYSNKPKIDVRQPIAADPSSTQLLNLAKRVAQSEATVMVHGPSGSGKEVLARYIHEQSERNENPFVAINCAAIPENMLEAVLFGYEKGAFTGATQASPGKFEQAQNGTILLDEVTEMDMALQAKLLRVLQEKEVERLGARKLIKLNVRVIATTNRDLMQAIGEGRFREDLYYRLNVFPLRWLPLSERKGDIVPLAEHLIQRHSSNSVNPLLSASAKAKLTQYNWPGNVRELENVVQRALILVNDNKIDADDLLIDLDDCLHIDNKNERNLEADDSHLGTELRQQEHQIILDTLQACNGRRKDVAEQLGISPRTLRYKLAKMRDVGIELPC